MNEIQAQTPQGRSDSTLKRQRGTPTGRTPQQPQKRLVAMTGGEERTICGDGGSIRRGSVRVSAQKRLFATPHAWTPPEDGALVEFILLTRPLDKVWPADKGKTYWEGAAKHVHSRSGSSVQRTGTVTILVWHLSVHFWKL